MDYITRSEVMLIGQIYSNTVGIFDFMWRNVFYYRKMEFLNSTRAYFASPNESNYYFFKLVSI